MPESDRHAETTATDLVDADRIGAAAATTDYTDIWFNLSEPAGGERSAERRFPVPHLFIYGADSKPTWFTGQVTLDASKTSTAPSLQRPGLITSCPGPASPARRPARRRSSR
jgi:hypothetical protein